MLLVHPSGRKSFTCYYRHGGRARWHHIADASVGIAAARRLAAAVLLEAAQGRDPAAERKADRRAGTFAQLHQLYLETCAKRRNRSWRQADYLIRAHVLPHLGRSKAAAIARGDVKLVLAKLDDRPATANQTLAAISAVYSWAITEEIGGVTANPCARVRRHPMRTRERVLSNSEIALVWPHLDSTLRLILLTGARIGEVVNMRSIDVDGAWHLPGAPAEGWPGTKNAKSHRIPLSEPAAAIVGEHLARRPKRRATEKSLDRLWRALGVPRFTSHDLRRTFGTLVTRFKHGRQTMDRLLNHSDRSVGAVYDRYEYLDDDQRAVDAVARHVARIIEGAEEDKVVRLFTTPSA